MFFRKLFDRIAIATKYVSKKHAFLEKQRKIFPCAMKYYNFVNIVDRVKLKYNLKEVYILGSDYWGSKRQVLKYLKENDIQSILTTNGTFSLLENAELISKYHLNLYSYFRFPDLQEKILQNLSEFLESNERQKIEILFPPLFEKESLDQARYLANKYEIPLLEDTSEEFKLINGQKIPIFHPDGKSVSWGLQYDKPFLIKDYPDLYQLEKKMLEYKKEILKNSNYAKM